jgi:hypothetical protein
MAVLAGQLVMPANKITKVAKGKMVKPVKPILKKLSSSPKNSLDLDRGWDEQDVEQLEADGWDEGYGYGGQARDVTFAVAGGDGIKVGGGGSGFRTHMKFHHGRSGSQTSAGSASRAGFVHPFAQTPRTSTPPLSYANSLASFDNGRDCSPTITENEDDDDFDAAHSIAHGQSLPTASRLDFARPSLSSQRTSSYHEVGTKSSPPSLRIHTGRSVSGTTAASSRFVHGSVPGGSHSDLHVDSQGLSVSVTGNLDSPTGSLGASTSRHKESLSSPLRTSLDMGQFPRLRSRSELDTATRHDQIRAARRKFEEREKIKEEEYDRKMIRKRERRDNKEATRIEKGEPPSRPSFHRKRTPTALSSVSAPPAGAASRPSMSGSLKHSNTHLGVFSSSAPSGSGDADLESHAEKHMGFASRGYDDLPLPRTPPSFGVTAADVQFEQTRSRRGSGTKRKTQSYWQGFILWLRTKLLRMSKH